MIAEIPVNLLNAGLKPSTFTTGSIACNPKGTSMFKVTKILSSPKGIRGFSGLAGQLLQSPLQADVGINT